MNGWWGSFMSDTSMPHSFAAIISVTYIITWIERDNTERDNKRQNRTNSVWQLLAAAHAQEYRTVRTQLWELVTVSMILVCTSRTNLSSLGEKRERAVRKTNLLDVGSRLPLSSRLRPSCFTCSTQLSLRSRLPFLLDRDLAASPARRSSLSGVVSLCLPELVLRLWVGLSDAPFFDLLCLIPELQFVVSWVRRALSFSLAELLSVLESHSSFSLSRSLRRQRLASCWVSWKLLIIAWTQAAFPCSV